MNKCKASLLIPFLITSSHLSYMFAFSWQNILVAGMTSMSYLRQDIKKSFPWKGVRVPSFFPIKCLGNCMVLLWSFTCSHSAWTAIRGTAMCWVTPMASPVVSSGSKFHQLTETLRRLGKKIGFDLPWFLNCSRLLTLMLRGSRGRGRLGTGPCSH